MMACDDYTVGTDSVEALDFADWPDQDLYLSKEYAEELEKAARQAGGRGKERGFYEFTSEALTDADEEQGWLSWRVDLAMMHSEPGPVPYVGFLPANLTKFCRVRRHDDKIAILDIRLEEPVMIRVGTFVGLIKQIDREVYAEKQDPEGLW